MNNESVDEDIETLQVALRVIVSFDVNAHRRVEASMITQFVHGREVSVSSNGRKKKYHYPGLTSRPSVEKLGQSVLLMREKDAEDFASFLRRLRVPFSLKQVWLRPSDLL